MLDGEYYIRKQIIPPLARIFNLIGVGKLKQKAQWYHLTCIWWIDIAAWYDEMPKQQKVSAIASSHYAQHEAQTARRIDQYYASSHCVVCRRLTKNGKWIKHTHIHTHLYAYIPHLSIHSHLWCMSSQICQYSLYPSFTTSRITNSHCRSSQSVWYMFSSVIYHQCTHGRSCCYWKHWIRWSPLQLTRLPCLFWTYQGQKWYSSYNHIWRVIGQIEKSAFLFL